MEKTWKWNDENNTKPIEVTVALPALNANKIIWLALESLKNQTDINFAWELICFEEGGRSREIIKSYIDKLPGCVRIIHKCIDKEDAHYTETQIKQNKCTSYYTLLEKWIDIAKDADKNSKIFVKHACDCYSSPNRLYIHYEHFKNDNCYYSTQPKGYFYNIKTNEWLLYDGAKREPIIWEQLGKPKFNNIDIKIRGCHLNMALRTKLMKKIPLSVNPKRRGLDGYILYNLVKLIEKRPEEEKIIFCDDEIDKNNWKYTLDTDGLNNISNRGKFYKKYNKKTGWYIPTKNNKVEIIIPDYILDRLKKL